jgi:hypothetical protein
MIQLTSFQPNSFALGARAGQPSTYAANRVGKIELFVGSADAVDAVMAQPVPQNQPVLRLTTNTFENQSDFGLFAPQKPIEKTLFAHTNVDSIVSNGVQGEDAGYYYPLKKGDAFGIRITDKDVEGFLGNVGVTRWAGLVANPVRLTRVLNDYLKDTLYKDAAHKPVTIQEVAVANTNTTDTATVPAVAAKPLNMLA